MNTTTQAAARLIQPSNLSTQINVLPKSAVMKGDMQATENLSIRLDGEYEGKISLQNDGTVHIACDANVTTGMVVADFIYVEGTVKGDLHARKAIELSPTARVQGSVRYEKDMDIHPGARISGQIIGPELDS